MCTNIFVAIFCRGPASPVCEVVFMFTLWAGGILVENICQLISTPVRIPKPRHNSQKPCGRILGLWS